MHNTFSDITSRIAEKPSWWDEGGVPRYGKFEPDNCSNIYIDQCALILIKCSGCSTTYEVVLTSERLEDTNSLEETGENLHYGDPPNYGHDEDCCEIAANSCPIKVLEFWIKEEYDWVRYPELEIPLEYGGE